MAASLLAAAVWRGEPTAVHPVAVKRMWQRLSLEALAFFLAAELIPAYIRSTVERLLTSVCPVGCGNVACRRCGAMVFAFS